MKTDPPDRLTRQQKWRLSVAANNFSVLTLGYGLLGFFGGLLTRWIPPHLNPLTKVPANWNRRVWKYCHHWVGQRLWWTSKPKRHSNAGLVIQYCNHPASLDTTLPALIGSHHADWIMVLMKSVHMWFPWGWGVWGIRCVIFVNRAHTLVRWWPWLSDVLRNWSTKYYGRQLQRLVKQASRGNRTAILQIYLDRRWTQERCDGQMLTFGNPESPKYIPGAETRLQDVLTFPYQGLLGILHAVGTSPVAFEQVIIATRPQSSGGYTAFSDAMEAEHLTDVRRTTEEIYALATTPGDLSTVTAEALMEYMNQTAWPSAALLIQDWRSRVLSVDDCWSPDA